MNKLRRIISVDVTFIKNIGSEYQIFSCKPERMKPFGDPSIDKCVALMFILKKYNVKLWIGLNWLTVRCDDKLSAVNFSKKSQRHLIKSL
jgi:hypothetical protein